MEYKEIYIKGDFIKLDSLLKFSSLLGSGGQAKNVILDGLVKVNGEICVQRGKKIRENDTVEYDNKGLIVKNAN